MQQMFKMGSVCLLAWHTLASEEQGWWWLRASGRRYTRTMCAGMWAGENKNRQFKFPHCISTRKLRSRVDLVFGPGQFDSLISKRTPKYECHTERSGEIEHIYRHTGMSFVFEMDKDKSEMSNKKTSKR
jgi:hypothetical protein